MTEICKGKIHTFLVEIEDKNKFVNNSKKSSGKNLKITTEEKSFLLDQVIQEHSPADGNTDNCSLSVTSLSTLY